MEPDKRRLTRTAVLEDTFANSTKSEQDRPLKTELRASVALLAILVGLASAADADPLLYGTFIWGGINNTGCSAYGGSSDPSCLFDGTDPRFFQPSNNVPYLPTTQSSGTLFDADEQISGSASLATGDLSVSFSSSGTSIQTSIAAFVWDTVTFHFADSAFHQVTVNMSGAVSIAGDPPLSAPSAARRLEFLPAAMNPSLDPNPFSLNGYSPIDNGPYNVSASTMVQDGTTVTLLAMLWVHGGGPSSGSAYDPLSFDIPDGGTFTSASGVLLTEDAAAPVPEPATLLLIGSGLSFGAIWRARRKR